MILSYCEDAQRSCTSAARSGSINARRPCNAEQTCCDVIPKAPRKSVPARFAPSISAPRTTAPARNAPRKSAFFKSASSKMVSFRRAPVRLASESLAAGGGGGQAAGDRRAAGRRGTDGTFSSICRQDLRFYFSTFNCRLSISVGPSPLLFSTFHFSIFQV